MVWNNGTKKFDVTFDGNYNSLTNNFKISLFTTSFSVPLRSDDNELILSIVEINDDKLTAILLLLSVGITFE